MNLFSLKTASLTLAIVLTGCASPARIDRMSLGSREVAAIKVAEPMRSNVAIREVTGGKDTNPLWVSNVGSADFERALEASLKAVGLLAADRQSGRYQVTAHLANLEQPLLGFDMDGRLWVQRGVIDGTPNEADVYSPEGKWVGIMQWPSNVFLLAFAVRGNTGLGVTTDGDAVQSVVRLSWK